MQDHNDAAQSSDEQPPDQSAETNDYLYVCLDCSVVCYHRMPECPACGSSDEKLTLAVVNEEAVA